MQAHSTPNSATAQTQKTAQNTVRQTPVPPAPVATPPAPEPRPQAKALELKPTAIVPKTPVDGSVRRSLAKRLSDVICICLLYTSDAADE